MRNSNVWVVVANKTGARIFEADSPFSGLRLVRRVALHELREASADQERDHHVSAESFAHKLSTVLDAAHRSGRFTELVLVAEPHFLGMLRLRFKRRLGRAVVSTIRKDLCRVPDVEVPKHLKGTITDLWRDPSRWKHNLIAGPVFGKPSHQ